MAIEPLYEILASIRAMQKKLAFLLVSSPHRDRRYCIPPRQENLQADHQGGGRPFGCFRSDCFGSRQVSTASQELAEGASEQAASIEETSSSLEEMSSMTKQNADNANQANRMMVENKDTVGRPVNQWRI